MNEGAIGVFDSGLGGLSVWRELRRALPHESLIYYGEGAHCPFGSRPPAEILAYTEQSVRALLDEGVKLVVIACNTATAVAVSTLRSRYDLPIVGMEPAVKPAALTTRTGVVGVLATAASLRGELFRRTSARYADRARILTAVGEGFVELVEAGEEHTPQAFEAVRRSLAPLLDAGADRIVLGCTHYPLLDEALRQAVAGRDVELIDPAPAVARRTAWLLDRFDLRCSGTQAPRYDFLSAAGPGYAERLRDRADRLCDVGPHEETGR